MRTLVSIAALAIAMALLISCGGSEPVTATTEAATVETAPEPEPTPAPEPTEPETPVPETTVPATTAAPVDGYDAPGNLVVPDPLEPGLPGEVIAIEDFDLVTMFGHRLVYHSQSAIGEDVAVSGFVVLPAGPTPEGGWPLIAWAHGTTGIGDLCAPSQTGTQYGVAALLAAEGYAVVATDYEGLGTPGRHPYIVGPSEAHSVLDSVRAVRNMGLPVTDEWIVFGHSQGGHAALFTAQLQPTYAPELELIGTIAAAPPSQILTTVDSLIGGDFQSYLVMLAVGQAAAYPEIDLATILTPAVMDVLDVVDTGCYLEIFKAFGPLPYEDVVAQPDVFETGAFADRLVAQDTNQLPTRQPLMIIHGDADELIPIETSALLLDQLCNLEGQAPTVRNVYPGESHAGVIFSGAAVPDLLDWAEARFAGESAPDDCQR